MQGDESQSQVYSNDQLLTLLLSCICATVFILLLLFDTWNAFRRRVIWIRGRALVLSALTIQLLSVIDNSSVTYGNSHHQIEEEVAVLLERDQLLIDSKRLMMCVFIGYLFPSMLLLSLQKKWSDIGALALSLTLHMGSELYFVWKYVNPKESVLWFTVYCTTLFLAIALLFVLFFCAHSAYIGIYHMMVPRINVAMLCCKDTEKRECKNTEDHVVRCWIVARCCHPGFIMARSIFSAFVGFIVTACVVIFAVKFSSVQILKYYGNLGSYVRKATLVSLFGFVLAGWIVILARWFIAVIYFPRFGFYWDESWITYFEDLWVKSLAKRKDVIYSVFKGRVFAEKRIRERRRGKDVMKNLMRPFQLQLLATAGLHMQIFIVSVSKACWFLSQIAPRLIRPLVMSRENNMLLSGLDMSPLEDDGSSNYKEFTKYKEVFDLMRMPGEIAYSLWITNKWAFKQIQNHKNNGFEEGKCKHEILINLMTQKTGPPKEEDDRTYLDEEKYLDIVGKTSWKMRAVSLIHFMIYFYDATICDPKDIEAVNNCIKAYTQAWEFLDMVDSSHSKVSSLLSSAADSEFDTVENIWNMHLKIKMRSKEDSIKLLENKIKTPLKADMDKLTNEDKQPETDQMEKPSKEKEKKWSWSFLKKKLSEEEEKEKLPKEDDKLSKEKKTDGKASNKTLPKEEQNKWSWLSFLKKKLSEEEEEEKLPKEEDKLSKEKKTDGKASHKNPSIDNLDWRRTVARISKYKTWKPIKDESPTIKKLQCSLASLLFHCIKEELSKALTTNCSKWATKWRDEKIFNAAFIVGKAKGVLHEMCEEMDEDHDAAHKV